MLCKRKLLKRKENRKQFWISSPSFLFCQYCDLFLMIFSIPFWPFRFPLAHVLLTSFDMEVCTKASETTLGDALVLPTASGGFSSGGVCASHLMRGNPRDHRTAPLSSKDHYLSVQVDRAERYYSSNVVKQEVTFCTSFPLSRSPYFPTLYTVLSTLSNWSQKRVILTDKSDRKYREPTDEDLVHSPYAKRTWSLIAFTFFPF